VRKFFEAEKICVVRTDAIGDMVLTLPMCAAIHRVRPDAEICLIARRYVEPLLYKTPAADCVFYIDDYENGIREIFRREKFGATFFPRPRFDEIKAAFMARVPLRVGSGYRWYSIMLNRRIYDHRKKGKYHEAEYNVRQVSAVAGVELAVEVLSPRINPVAEEKVRRIIDKQNFRNGYIILHPGSRGSARDWSPEKFGRFAREIYENYKINSVITGVESESESCAAVHTECASSVNLCGRLDLYELIALAARSRLTAANSTGVLHIAAALGRPVVGLYPNTSHIGPRRWGPLTKNKIVLTPPRNADDPDDMSLIKVEEAVAAVGCLLNC
jgi:ADP-heptose:LPS heptosyltransferase